MLASVVLLGALATCAHAPSVLGPPPVARWAEGHDLPLPPTPDPHPHVTVLPAGPVRTDLRCSLHLALIVRRFGSVTRRLLTEQAVTDLRGQGGDEERVALHLGEHAFSPCHLRSPKEYHAPCCSMMSVARATAWTCLTVSYDPLECSLWSSK